MPSNFCFKNLSNFSYSSQKRCNEFDKNEKIATILLQRFRFSTWLFRNRNYKNSVELLS